MALSVGTRLGHYDVTALLGEGGMGQVWQATDTQLNRQVALKILPDAFATDPDRLARFTREAQILASLNHPNIAAIYGIEEAEGTRALVLELVEGPTLADRIRQGPIPLDEALPIAKQIAEALEAAHEASVIHRDLKPANIKVREDGTVKVLDFGLAKALDPNPEGDPSQSPTLTAAATQMGVILGTAAYMSPEQARGRPVDKRTDIWAFGAVLFEMLTGTKPFPGDDISQTLARVIDREPDWDALQTRMPAGLRTVLRRCLEKDPKRRIRDIGDVGLALDGAFETPTPPAPEATTAAQPKVWQRPSSVTLIAVLTAFIGALAVWTSTRVDVVQPALMQLAVVPPDTALLEFGGSDRNLAISRDGTQLAYISYAAGEATRVRLSLRPLGEPGVTTLVGGVAGGPYLEAPFFAPDGEWVGLVGNTGRTLQKVLTIGGTPTTLYLSVRQIRGASWGADDQIVVGQRGAGLLSVSAESGEAPEVLTTLDPDDGDLGHAWPSIIPGRQAVLFVMGTNVSRQLAVLELDTRQVTKLGIEGTSPRYVQTGHLLYVGWDGTLRGVSFDVSRLEVTGTPVALVEGVMVKPEEGAANYGVSDDGRLVYVSEAGNVAGPRSAPLVWVARNGSVEPVETIPAHRYRRPLLSPDGERLLIHAGDDFRIYELETGRETRVTTDGLSSGFGAWAPTGAEVAYSSARGESGEENVWVQQVDGSGVPRQLTQDGRVHVDAWSPDGRTLIVHKHRPDNDGTDLYTVSLESPDTEPEIWLLVGSAPVFSPDGRFVAYLSTETRRSQLHIMPFPGPGGRLTVSVDGAIEPVWAANGELFYRRLSDYTMMVVTDPTPLPGPPIELFEGTYPFGGRQAFYTVTGDGQRFLMPADRLAAGAADPSLPQPPRVEPQINVVLNWFEELKRLVPIP